MDRESPIPLIRFLRVRARVIEPLLVDEFGGTIGPAAPGHRGDGIDDHLSWIFVSHVNLRFLVRGTAREVQISERLCRMNPQWLEFFRTTLGVFDGCEAHDTTTEVQRSFPQVLGEKS